MQALGRLSYSWYLWHWPVLVMATALVPTLALAGRLAAAAGALGLAALTFALVENPIRFHRSLVPRPRRSLAFAAGLSVLALGLALGARQRLTMLHASEPYKAILAATDDEPTLRGCMLGFTGRRLRECVFGDTASTTTVVLFGDSHAAHWFPAIEYAAREHGWRLVTLLKAACATANVPVYNQVAGGRDDVCDGWRTAALRRIDALRPTAVVLSNSQGYVIRPGREDGYSMLSDVQWESGSRQTFQRLNDAASHVLYLRDSPRLMWDIPMCLSRAAHRKQDASVCTADREVAVDSHVFDAERRAAVDLSRISMLDLSDLFCGPEQCEPVRDGMIVYRDHSHLTAAYVRRIAPQISERLAAAMPREELSRR